MLLFSLLGNEFLNLYPIQFDIYIVFTELKLRKRWSVCHMFCHEIIKAKDSFSLMSGLMNKRYFPRGKYMKAKSE